MKLMICSVIVCFAEIVYGAPRIIGGKHVEDGKYPYEVAIEENSEHLCGGSILNERWILTAAQCLLNKRLPKIKVIVGTNDRLSENRKTYRVEYVVYHEEYNPKLKQNDIGLIRVNKDIKFDDKIQPIRLPEQDLDAVGHPVTLIGWGSVDNLGNPNNELQEVELKINDQTNCALTWLMDFIVTKSQICTQAEYGKGACYGDSGSPLVANGVQVGIASFGKPCGRGLPDVYTRVYSFLDWIANEQADYLTHF